MTKTRSFLFNLFIFKLKTLRSEEEEEDLQVSQEKRGAIERRIQKFSRLNGMYAQVDGSGQEYIHLAEKVSRWTMIVLDALQERGSVNCVVTDRTEACFIYLLETSLASKSISNDHWRMIFKLSWDSEIVMFYATVSASYLESWNARQSQPVLATKGLTQLSWIAMQKVLSMVMENFAGISLLASRDDYSSCFVTWADLNIFVSNFTVIHGFAIS
ncbi:hypothetical protein Tco_1090605 [Tanacetum coccineum]|uniref:Uncharacterized protein n=1 Tax=Tanacetum coccineum TaxID=301880 RepID=A0ABQ5I4Q0_9ASTR